MGNRTSLGKITKIDESTFSWKVNNFKKSNVYVISSPTFNVELDDNRECFKLIFGRVDHEILSSKYWMSLCRKNTETSGLLRIRYSAGFKNKYGQIFYSTEGEETFCTLKDVGGFDQRAILTVPQYLLFEEIEETMTVSLSIHQIQESRNNSIHRPCSVELLKDQFSDVKIMVDLHIFNAHYEILAAKSSVFKKKLKPYRLTTLGPLVFIATQVAPHLFDIFLKAIYGQMDRPFVDNVEAMLKLADRYECSDIKVACEKILIKKISPPQTSRLLRIAKKYRLISLKKHTMEYIKRSCFNRSTTTISSNNKDGTKRRRWRKSDSSSLLKFCLKLNANKRGRMNQC